MRFAMWVLVNMVWLLPFAYGIKCLVTLSGQCVGARAGHKWGRRWQFDLIPVEDETAIWTGLGYVALAVFVCLSMYSKFDADRSFVWQLILVPIRWGSLLAMLWFWYKACPWW